MLRCGKPLRRYRYARLIDSTRVAVIPLGRWANRASPCKRGSLSN